MTGDNMRKIEIIDCCNIEHKISMIISDNKMNFFDDVYCAIKKNEGLSQNQVKKLQSFRESCNGPIMVHGYYFGDNGSNYIASREFDWTCFYVYEADGNVFIEYSTRVHGDRPCVYKMSKDNYKDIDATLDEIHRMESLGEYNNKIMSRIWVGSRIY